MTERIGVYPGTFDPATNGHLDIICRAVSVVDKLVIGVAVNAGKDPLFTAKERVEMLREDIAHLSKRDAQRITVKPFDNLLMDFAAACGASLLIRGLRAVSDFEYEFQMGSMNARLNPAIETVFLMASERSHFISSRFVKEISRLGGDVSSMVSPRVVVRLNERFAKKKGRKSK